MAASLVKSMFRLCLQVSEVSQLQIPKISAQTFIVSRNYSSLFLGKQDKTVSPGLKTNLSSLQVCSFHTTPAVATTPELKEWRQHRIINRFYRLNWGGWIRTLGGRYKSLYKKSPQVRWYLKQHVFCNAKQSKLLNTLVTANWKEPKYYVDSPYEPYHNRVNSNQFPTHRKFYP